MTPWRVTSHTKTGSVLSLSSYGTAEEALEATHTLIQTHFRVEIWFINDVTRGLATWYQQDEPRSILYGWATAIDQPIPNE